MTEILYVAVCMTANMPNFTSCLNLCVLIYWFVICCCIHDCKVELLSVDSFLGMWSVYLPHCILSMECIRNSGIVLIITK